MKIFTAETSDGSVWMILGRVEEPPTRQDFADLVIANLHLTPGDDAPHQLHLYEWADAETAGVWLEGKVPVAGATWPSMGRDACYGEVRYEYVGGGNAEYFYTPTVRA